MAGTSVDFPCVYVAGREQSDLTLTAEIVGAPTRADVSVALLIAADGVWSPAGQQTQWTSTAPLVAGEAVSVTVRITATIEAAGVVAVRLFTEYSDSGVPPTRIQGPSAEFSVPIEPAPATATEPPEPTATSEPTASTIPTAAETARPAPATTVQPTEAVDEPAQATAAPRRIGIAATSVTPVVNQSGNLTCSLADRADPFIEPGQSRVITCTHSVGGLLVGARMDALVPTQPAGWTVRIQGTGSTGGDSGTHTGLASLYRLLQLSNREFTITVTAPASDTGYGAIRPVRIQACTTDALNIGCLSTPAESLVSFTLQDPTVNAAQITCDTGSSGTSVPQSGSLLVPCRVEASQSAAPDGLAVTRIEIRWTPIDEALAVGFRSDSGQELSSTSGVLAAELNATASPGGTVEFFVAVMAGCAPVGERVIVSLAADVTPLTESGQPGLPSNEPALASSPLALSVTASDIPLSVRVTGGDLTWSVETTLSDQVLPPRDVTLEVTTPGCGAWTVAVQLDGPLRGGTGGRAVPARFLQVVGISPPAPATGATAGIVMGPLSRPVVVLSGSATGSPMTYTQTIRLQPLIPGGTLTGSYRGSLIVTVSAVPP